MEPDKPNLKTPFEAPKDYFGNLTIRIGDRVALVEAIGSAQPVPHGFTAPASYWDGLLASIQARLAKANIAHQLSWGHRLAYASSMVLAIACLVYVPLGTTPTNEMAVSPLSADEYYAMGMVTGSAESMAMDMAPTLDLSEPTMALNDPAKALDHSFDISPEELLEAH